MKKTQFISKPNFKFSNACCERVSKKSSETVQGQAYTIPQLFARFAAGDTRAGVRSTYYPDDVDYDDPDFDSLSRADIEDRHAVMQETAEVLERVAAAKQAAAKKQADAVEAASKAAKEAQRTDATDQADSKDVKPASKAEGSKS